MHTIPTDNKNESSTSRGRRIWVRIIKALGITAVAFLLSWLVAQPFSFSMSTLVSSQDKKDFNITDFCNIVADSRPVRTLDKEIVVVNIDRASRNDITDLLAIVSIMEPKAVGLDVTFNECRQSDTLLLDAISSLPQVVMAQCVSQNRGGVF